jgi:hypothetical protein
VAGGAAPTTDSDLPPGAVATEPTGSPFKLIGALSLSKAVGAFVLGGALVLALATAGFLIARRRRTGSPPL